MTAENRIDPLRIIEAGVLFVAAFGWMSRLVDLTPLFREWLGIRPGPPDFAMVDPFYPLLRGVIGVALLTYLLLLLWRPGVPGYRPLAAVAWFLIVLGLSTPALRDMWDRAQDEARNDYGRFRSQTHDGGVLQTELAMAAVANGQNPYEVDYGGTMMARGRDSDEEGWRRLGYARNPALGHVPYLPAAFLVSMPLWWLSEATFGWYDQRVFYVLAAIAFAWLCGLLVERGPLRRIVWLVAGSSQLLLPFVRIGRNDILLLLWLAAFAVLLQRKRVVAAGAMLGLACATKQFAWFAALPYAVWVWFDPAWRGETAKKAIGAMAAVFLIVCLPFFLWSPHAFFDDVIAFNLGFATDSYPLRPDSIGAASLVLGMGWTNTLRGGFPMWALQLAITVPVTLALLTRLTRQPSPAAMFVAAGLILYTALFCSAFFELSYLIVPGALVMFGGLLSRPYPDSPAR